MQHVLRGLGRGDVAVTDDGDAAHGLHDGADTVEVDAAGEALGAGAAVDKDSGDADLFEHAGKVGRGQVLLVPAEAHLGGDGNVYGLDHAAHEGGRFFELGHHGGAAADLDDLFDGATHVNVDGLDADFFAHFGGVPHLGGHAAEKLDGERLVAGRGGDETEGDAAALEEGTGVNKIGRGPVEPAEFAHGEAHGQVRVSSEWR